jgi:predicted O-linked N-acetylglucosamine transferase (SPINDLY family)
MPAAAPELAEQFAVAQAHHQAGRLAEAERVYRRICEIDPRHFDALHCLGLLAGQMGRREIATDLIRRAIALKPDYVEAHFNLGNMLAQQNKLDQAVTHFARAVALRPEAIEAQYCLGLALLGQGECKRAIECFARAIALKPDFAEAHFAQGSALAREGRPDDAAARFRRALALRPAFAEAHSSLGTVLSGQGHFVEAAACFERALALDPNLVEALYNQGRLLAKQGRFAEAVPQFRRALTLGPNDARVQNDLGAALSNMGNIDEAMACFARALAIRPGFGRVHFNIATTLWRQGKLDEATAQFERAAELDPDFAETYSKLGLIFLQQGKFDEGTRALALYEKKVATDPNHPHAFGARAFLALVTCDWSKTAKAAAEIETHIVQRTSVVTPFAVLGYSGDPALQLQCAKRTVEENLPMQVPPLWEGAAPARDRLKIAYLSSDFRQHAVATVIAELLERHDRTRFEIVGISAGPDDHSDLRRRIIGAFDEFHDVAAKSDRDIAAFLHGQQVDIAVDLNGHTQYSRLSILLYRPAPVQATFLGYPATTGADFIDYVIADEIIVPFSQQPFYTERIVHLPDCYLPYDSTQRPAARMPSPQEAGLPQHSFVFCAFHNSYKITPALFAVWMRLLQAVEHSVLWLAQMNGQAMANLRAQARAHGVAPERLIFAPKVARVEDHLSRLRLAGLFLDTLPYNAHSSAADALRAGLPVVTCTGSSFAGRVATSLLRAVGLPELATQNLAEYEALAMRLATDPALLQSFRQRLVQNQATCALFDSDRYRRNIESAFGKMWEIAQRGEGPQSFSVEAAG